MNTDERSKMSFTATSTPDAYAAELIRLVERDLPDLTEEAGLQGIELKSWTDLHEVCDANEFLLEADENLGVNTLDTIDFCNQAIAIAEKTLFPKAAV